MWGGLLLVVLPAIVAFVVVSRRARKRLEDAVDARTKSIARRSGSGPILETMPTVPAPHAVMNRARVPFEGVDTAASVAALEAGLADPSAATLVTTGSGQPEYADVNYANMDGDSRPDPVYEALVCPGLCAKPVHAAPPDGPTNAIVVGADTANDGDTAYLVPETKNPDYVYADSARGAAASPAAAPPEYADVDYADLVPTTGGGAGLSVHTVVPAEAPYGHGAAATGIAPHIYEYCEPSLVLAQASVSAAGDDGSAMVSSDSPRRS